MKNMIKCTFNIQTNFLSELKLLTQQKEISSVNHGINDAIKLYLRTLKKNQYELLMDEAVKDSKFIQRLKDVEFNFDRINQSNPGEW